MYLIFFLQSFVARSGSLCISPGTRGIHVTALCCKVETHLTQADWWVDLQSSWPHCHLVAPSRIVLPAFEWAKETNLWPMNKPSRLITSATVKDGSRSTPVSGPVFHTMHLMHRPSCVQRNPVLFVLLKPQIDNYLFTCIYLHHNFQATSKEKTEQQHGP